MTDYPVERGSGLTPEQKLAARQAQARDEGRGPVRPQDHQSPRGHMKAYGTRPVDIEFLGKIWTVIPTVLDDWDLIEKQADGTMEQMSLPSQYRAMLGYEAYEELKAAVREEEGYVSARVLGSFLQVVQEKLDGGNS